MTTSTPRRALLLGLGGMLWPLPPLLRAAGFEVDVLALPSPHFRHRLGLRTVRRQPDRRSLLVAAAELDRRNAYNWIIVGDDDTLIALRDHPDLTLAQKERLAPVVTAEHLGHLGSKVAQAAEIDRAGVPVPAHIVVNHVAEAVDAAEQLGWPAFLKADAGSGGRGVARCSDAEELRQQWRRLIGDSAGASGQRPAGGKAIVQQAIEGTMLDLSGFFFDGQLVHFTNALGNQMPGRIGMSTVRRYRPTASGDPLLTAELQAIGQTMGIDGFANISAIEAPDGTRWYFEVDLRPTIWAPYGAEFGDDPALRLRAWFDDGTALASMSPELSGQPRQGRDIACFTRQTRLDLARNRQRVLGDVPWRNPDGVLLLAKSLIVGGDL